MSENKIKSEENFCVDCKNFDFETSCCMANRDYVFKVAFQAREVRGNLRACPMFDAAPLFTVTSGDWTEEDGWLDDEGPEEEETQH